ncbi:MAG: hypothetical protein SGBAC_001197 [Bacillariaceae sp.]
MPTFKVNIPPEGKLGIKLKDGPEMGNVIKLYKILEDSVMEGKLLVDDVILSMGGTKVSKIEQLLPLVQKLEGEFRYFMVERQEGAMVVDPAIGRDAKPQQDLEPKIERDIEPKKGVEAEVDPDKICLGEETGIEVVKAPQGSLGIRLGRQHKVLEVIASSPLLGMVFVDDSIVSLNYTDVTNMVTKDFVKFLSEQTGETRVLGIKRAPNSPRQVPVPPVAQVGLVLRDNPDGFIMCLDLLDTSPLKGIVFAGDRVIGANCRKVTKIAELVPLMKDKTHRVLTVVTPKKVVTENGSSNRRRSPQKAITARYPKGSLKAKSVSEETAMITSYKTVGQEVFVNVIAPKGKLGLKLGKNHEVMDLLSTSPLAGKIFKNDRVVSIDEVDIRGKNASSLAVLLMASQHRARALGVRRKTGTAINIAVQETRKQSIKETHEEEFEQRFPTLYELGVPMGDEATDTSTRCKVLSELLVLHETIGLANDVETENGSFCHVIKIPKKGLSRKGELMSTLDDLMASLDSICGTENDASDLLLEFLANRSPNSFLKHKSIAESRPTKRRKIQESKVDPDLPVDGRKRVSRDGAIDSLSRIENGNPPGAKVGETVSDPISRIEYSTESQTTETGEGGQETQMRMKDDIGSGGTASSSATEPIAKAENDSTSEFPVVAGIPNPLASTGNGTESSGVAQSGVVADPPVRTDNGTDSGIEDGVPNPLGRIEKSTAPEAAVGEDMNGTESGALRNTNDVVKNAEPQSKDVDIVNAPTDPTSTAGNHESQPMITN